MSEKQSAENQNGEKKATGNQLIDGPRLLPASGGPARQLVILLHGVGADGNDLFALAPQLAQVLLDAAFVSPHAPEPFDMAPTGRQWFSLIDRTPDSIVRGARKAASVLDAFIEAELVHHDLSDADLALVGFSQGTMMALYVALRRAQACAAIVGFSGALVDDDRGLSGVAAKPPILLVHGDADEVVPVAAHYDAVTRLLAAGFSVESHIRPGLPHGIDGPGLDYCKAFLAKHLAPAS